ncbi:hypothetical protein ACTQ33_00615 [Candidatus Avoscillospira sp. LCP25S3_F1]|uniref:hypothetical protein n=1 Tax=Candidatus Avoscillospira sp. LCP25S3_F1 TaxID=3438825 RepID=UPI003F910D9C
MERQNDVHMALETRASIVFAYAILLLIWVILDFAQAARRRHRDVGHGFLLSGWDGKIDKFLHIIPKTVNFCNNGVQPVGAETEKRRFGTGKSCRIILYFPVGWDMIK